MNLSVRCFLIIIFLISFSIFPHAAVQGMTFVVIGDTRPGKAVDPTDKASQSGDFISMITQINQLAPDFTIDVGDFILGYNRDIPAMTENQWDRFDQAVKMFKNKFYMAAGNHDVYDEASDAIYRKRYGPHFYSFNRENSLFVILNAEIPGQINQIGQEQRFWLENELLNSSAAHKFIFIHKPLWLDGSSDWMSMIHPMLKKYKVSMVFAGHYHQYEPFKIDGIDYFITGGGGAETGSIQALGEFFHFIKVTVPDQGPLVVKVIKAGSNREYDTDLILPGIRPSITSALNTFKPGTAICLGKSQKQKIRFLCKIFHQ